MSQLGLDPQHAWPKNSTNIFHERDKRRRTDIIRKESSHFWAHQSSMPLRLLQLVLAAANNNNHNRAIIVATSQKIAPEYARVHASVVDTKVGCHDKHTTENQLKRNIREHRWRQASSRCIFIVGLNDAVQSAVEVSRCFPGRRKMRALPAKHSGVLQEIVDGAQRHLSSRTCSCY